MSRGFFITRAASNSEDPTALEFWPAKGSDELHEALKQAFPLETNLAARMRQAVIEFLLQEQQAEFEASTSPEYLPSPQSSFVSTLPSPAMPVSHMSTEISQPRRLSATGQPSQQELTHVWSLESKPQAKIHTRRTMTAEEKKAYKQKRLLGACADCKKRRRKCEHNTFSSSTSPPPRKAGKHKKRVTSHTSSKAPMPAVPGFSTWGDFDFGFETDVTSMALATEFDTEMPSFDLESSGFDMGQELSTDWQLFPDFSNSNSLSLSPASSWPSDFAMFDTPLSSSTRNPSSTSDGGAHTNISHAPVIPASLSPMSRSQSSDSGNHNPVDHVLPDHNLLDRVAPNHVLQGQLPAPNWPSQFAMFDGSFSSPSQGTSSSSTTPYSTLETPTSQSPMSRSQSSDSLNHNTFRQEQNANGVLQGESSQHRNVHGVERNFLDLGCNADILAYDSQGLNHNLPDTLIQGRCEPCTERGHLHEGRRPDCDLCFKALALSESRPQTMATCTTWRSRTTVLIPTGACFTGTANQLRATPRSERLAYNDVPLAESGGSTHSLLSPSSSSPSDWSGAQAPIATLMVLACASSNSVRNVASVLAGYLALLLCFSLVCQVEDWNIDDVKTKIQVISLVLVALVNILSKSAPVPVRAFTGVVSKPTRLAMSQALTPRQLPSARNMIHSLECWIDSRPRGTRTSFAKTTQMKLW